MATPRSFFKVIAYATDDTLTSRAFLLAQDIDDLEKLTLDGFNVHQVALGDLTDLTSLMFDPVLVLAQAQPVLAAAGPSVRRLRSVEDLIW